jgi:hypothetical protein
MTANNEKTHVVELTDKELKEILSAAVKQLIRSKEEFLPEDEVNTLSSVIEKCCKISKSSH